MRRALSRRSIRQLLHALAFYLALVACLTTTTPPECFDGDDVPAYCAD